MKKHLITIFIFLSIMISAGCHTQPQVIYPSSTPGEINQKVSGEASPSTSPTPEPTNPPVQMLLPSGIGIKDSLYYGMDRQSVINIMGTPDKMGDPEATLSPSNNNYSPDYYQDFLIYFTELNGYKKVALIFQFYHFSGKNINKFYGLERVIIEYKGSEKNCKNFMASMRTKLDTFYGEPSSVDKDEVIWNGDDEKGYPNVESSIWYGDSFIAEIKFYKHTPYKEIAEKEVEDAYFATIKSGVTLENYNMIEEDMEYDTVIRYLGYGEKTGESKMDGTTYTYYKWYSDNAVIRIQFIDNKVSIIQLTGNLY